MSYSAQAGGSCCALEHRSHDFVRLPIWFMTELVPHAVLPKDIVGI